MKKSIIAISLISALCFTSCGSDASSSGSGKSSNAASTTSVTSVSAATETSSAAETTEARTTQLKTETTTEKTTENKTENTTELITETPDYSPSDLVGEWVETNSFNNILTVNDDATFSLKYEGGGTRSGIIKIDSEEHPDGSFTYWYSFYDNDNNLWTGFVCPEKPFDEIYSEDEGGMKFVRNNSEKPLAPTIPEAKDLRDALRFADRLMSGSAVETDMNAEYKTDDGTIYHKSVDNVYKTTSAVRDYLYDNMTEQYISSHYAYLIDTENPKCIDVNGELYIEYRPIGGIYCFEDEDPVVTESENGYSINVKNNNYGAEETVVIDVVKEDGKWKINEVHD